MDMPSPASELPSLATLLAFEAAWRHQSFTRAAEELGRTQGAVSRQVANLERDLGLELFVREHPNVRPTRAGEVFARKVGGVIDRLQAAVVEVRAFGGQGGVLNLAILPTFGTRWLIPRIARFYAAHPDVSVNFTTRLVPFDFDADDLDAAIHYGLRTWPRCVLDPLMGEEVQVVCSPELASRGPLAMPADLAGHTMLQLSSRLGAWQEWLDSVGVAGIDGRRGPRFEHHLMIIQAATAGLGVALLPSFLVRKELETGQLVEPFPGTTLSTSRSYWLAYPERSRKLPALRAFRRWLNEELAADADNPWSDGAR